MLRALSSAYVTRVPLKGLESAIATCISCRTRRRPLDPEHIRSVPEERKKITQLDDLDLNELRPQYRRVKALEGAPEQVQRIFSLKFGTIEEKMEAKYLEYAEKLQRHKYDYDSPEMQIASLTLRIRKLQEVVANMLYEKKEMRLRLQSMTKERNDLLLELRSKNYEKYCLTMKVLDLNLVFSPEYNVRSTARIKNITDMKIRTFAEIQRRKNEHEQKLQEVSQLWEEILNKLKSGELTPPEDEPS